jgi:hypothetical protein
MKLKIKFNGIKISLENSNKKKNNVKSLKEKHWNCNKEKKNDKKKP